MPQTEAYKEKSQGSLAPFLSAREKKGGRKEPTGPV